jgi:hypothetical protein
MLFSPTPKKILWTVLVPVFAAATLLLRMIPVEYDILDLREIPGFVMALFLVFPSGAELFGALAIALATVYLIVCIVFRLKEKGPGKFIPPSP